MKKHQTGGTSRQLVIVIIIIVVIVIIIVNAVIVITIILIIIIDILQAFAESANTAIGRHQSSNRRIGDVGIYNDFDDDYVDGDVGDAVDFNCNWIEYISLASNRRIGDTGIHYDVDDGNCNGVGHCWCWTLLVLDTVGDVMI